MNGRSLELIGKKSVFGDWLSGLFLEVPRQALSLMFWNEKNVIY